LMDVWKLHNISCSLLRITFKSASWIIHFHMPKLGGVAERSVSREGWCEYCGRKRGAGWASPPNVTARAGRAEPSYVCAGCLVR
jgi:hypothetical protein